MRYLDNTTIKQVNLPTPTPYPEDGGELMRDIPVPDVGPFNEQLAMDIVGSYNMMANTMIYDIAAFLVLFVAIIGLAYLLALWIQNLETD